MFFLSLYAIFKNESHILKEWILHYLEEGVQHFYLIDNGSTDDYKPIIEQFKEKITLFVDPTKNAQLDLYRKYVLPEINNSTWIIGCDLDEFIWGVDYNIADSLRLIDDNDPDKKIACIQIPWEMFGSSGIIEQPKYVVPNFTKRLKYTNNIYINCKTIARTSAVTNLDVHYFHIKNDLIVLDSTLTTTFLGPNHDLNEDIIKKAKFRCAHYAIQSYNWFKNVKMTRGDVATKDSDNVRNEQYFKDYDYNDIIDLDLFNKHKLLYDNLNKEESNMNIKEDFIAPWTPQHHNDFILITRKINIYTLLFALAIFIIIFFIMFKM